MPLKDALQALNNAVSDLTSLHVQTFSGEIDSTISDMDNFTNIKAAILQAKTAGTITLVAETLAKFDGDSYNFIKQNIDSVPAKALEVHQNAVESGINTRLGLLDLFKDLIS